MYKLLWGRKDKAIHWSLWGKLGIHRVQTNGNNFLPCVFYAQKYKLVNLGVIFKLNLKFTPKMYTLLYKGGLL